MSDGICLIIHLEYHLRTVIMHNVCMAERMRERESESATGKESS